MSHCIFCHMLARKQIDARDLIQVCLTKDSMGTPYFQVMVPMCEDHDSIPGIIHRTTGSKPEVPRLYDEQSSSLFPPQPFDHRSVGAGGGDEDFESERERDQLHMAEQAETLHLPPECMTGNCEHESCMERREKATCSGCVGLEHYEECPKYQRCL